MTLQTTIEQLVIQWTNVRHIGCPMHELFSGAELSFVDLTIGQFHDALRQLHKEKVIRLTGWSKSIDEMPRSEVALIVQGKVMYYASLPQ